MAPQPSTLPKPGAKPKGVIRRAPKWAWFTVGGVVIGVVVIKFWRDRATDASASVEVGTTQGESPTSYGGSGSGGLIVPPVIISPPASDPNIGVPALQDAFIQSLTDMAQGWRDIYGPIADIIPGLIPTPQDYLSIMQGGGNPNATAPVVVTTPAPPASTQAPAPAPAPGAKQAACPTEFPFRSARGCYKVVCASGKGDKSKGHWHYYQSGTQLHVDNTC
ncbi:MAG TPA: hypothetical protein VM715_17305 [Candidatus Acidoferrum sp.]|nr:hypothetical protein [Candidatus Acidoferrum sp.]